MNTPVKTVTFCTKDTKLIVCHTTKDAVRAARKDDNLIEIPQIAIGVLCEDYMTPPTHDYRPKFSENDDDDPSWDKSYYGKSWVFRRPVEGEPFISMCHDKINNHGHILTSGVPGPVFNHKRWVLLRD